MPTPEWLFAIAGANSTETLPHNEKNIARNASPQHQGRSSACRIIQNHSHKALLHSTMVHKTKSTEAAGAPTTVAAVLVCGARPWRIPLVRQPSFSYLTRMCATCGPLSLSTGFLLCHRVNLTQFGMWVSGNQPRKCDEQVL